MPLPDEQVDVIAAAMLASNQYSLLRAQDLMPRLREARLLDVEYVCSLEPNQLAMQLANAGYDRGTLTSMFGDRLRSLLVSLASGKLDSLCASIEAGDEAHALQVLVTVKGIGPVVAKTAWVLLKLFKST